MHPETITTIVIGLVGSLLTILFATVAFFTMRSYNAIDANMARHAESINQLVLNIKDLASAISSIKDHFAMKHDAAERTLKEHHEEIEMLRTRTHDASADVNYLFGEAKKAGWDTGDRPVRTFAAVRPRRE